MSVADKILHGDAYACLEYLEDNSISVAITSPPYFQQRDYGFDGQIGQETSSEEYIGRLVAIFNKLRNKLREDGIFFLNVGDKYLNRYGKSHLLQIPYRLAYHMVKNGWILEDIIIWFKKNHMPSSVKDRFANTYEPVFVFAKHKDNSYKKGAPNIVKIPLQQTPWKHTAVYPERLVEELLFRTLSKEGDIILDPFAGTGTTAYAAKKMRASLLPKNISVILIEKGSEFIDIIQERTRINNVVKIKEIPYNWKPVTEETMPSVEPLEILTNKYGELFIAKDDKEFISALKGIALSNFKAFHREDALFFFGVKKWSLDCLYYIYHIYKEGYVLRNMIIISEHKNWYPVFMFSFDSTRVAYKFYLDRVRTKPASKESRNWINEEFVGMKVRDIYNNKQEGRLIKVIKRYPDGFPKIVIVQWDGSASVELVIHPNKDEILMEGLIFLCPYCKNKLEETYDPTSENRCTHCNRLLWTDISNIPLIQEPNEIEDIINEIENGENFFGQVIKIDRIEETKKTLSKFVDLKRINWGASPGARKLMLGEYFTKMRLYRIDQPTVAQFLTILRKHKNMSINEITNYLPKEYLHTVGHWFRKDFGGSIPIPKDIILIKELFKLEHKFFEILQRTGLKFQTVKVSIKGKNPGDFLEIKDNDDLNNFFKKLYLPSQYYIYYLDHEKKNLGDLFGN